MTKSQAKELIDFTINLALSVPMGRGVTFSKENKETLVAALIVCKNILDGDKAQESN